MKTESNSHKLDIAATIPIAFLVGNILGIFTAVNAAREQLGWAASFIPSSKLIALFGDASLTIALPATIVLIVASAFLQRRNITPHLPAMQPCGKIENRPR